MGCLRLGFAFIVSLFFMAILTFIGGVVGAVISFLLVSHGAITLNLSSPDLYTSTSTYIGGGIGLLLGLFIMIALMRRAVNVNWLKSKGTRIVARVVDIEKKTGSRQVPTGPNGQMQTQMYWYYVVFHMLYNGRAKTQRKPLALAKGFLCVLALL